MSTAWAYLAADSKPRRLLFFRGAAFYNRAMEPTLKITGTTCSACGLKKEEGKSCSPCRLEYFRRYRAAHREKFRDYNAKYMAAGGAEKAALRRAAHREERNARDREAYDPEKARAYRFANREKRNAECKRWREANAERVAAANKERCRIWRLTHGEWIAEWREKNREHLRAYASSYGRTHREQCRHIAKVRRARKAGCVGSYTRAEWLAIVKNQGGKCAICKTRTKLTVDHVIPIAKGGSNYAFNIQGLCASCNSRKRHFLIPGAQHSLFDKAS